ncbi:hypothetical protein [Sphingopyxis alaskensis]
MGRAGTVAARLLIELGITGADTAIAQPSGGLGISCFLQIL